LQIFHPLVESPIASANVRQSARHVIQHNLLRAHSNPEPCDSFTKARLTSQPCLEINNVVAILPPCPDVRGICPVGQLRMGIRNDAPVEFAVQIEVQRVRSGRYVRDRDWRLWSGDRVGGGA